jgi:hypothetical protein
MKAGKTRAKTLSVSMSKERQAVKAKLDELANKLGCGLTDLIWFALDRIIQNPPSLVPRTVYKIGGTAPGFWTVHKRKGDKVTSISIIEVAARANITDGRQFYRYKKDDAKSRKGALDNAKHDGAYDAQLAGVKSAVKVTLLQHKK